MPLIPAYKQNMSDLPLIFICNIFSKHISGLHTAFWPRDVYYQLRQLRVIRNSLPLPLYLSFSLSLSSQRKRVQPWFLPLLQAGWTTAIACLLISKRNFRTSFVNRDARALVAFPELLENWWTRVSNRRPFDPRVETTTTQAPGPLSNNSNLSCEHTLSKVNTKYEIKDANHVMPSIRT